MSLRLLGSIQLPGHAKDGGFDHAAVHHGSSRLYIAHTANDDVDVVDSASDRFLRSIHGLKGVAGVLVSDERDLLFTANRREDADGVLAAMRREEEIAFVRDEHARDALQSVHGVTETVGGGVHDVDIIVRGMGDVEPRRSMMNRSVIETALLCMRGKIDGAEQPEAHQVACSNLAFPSTLSLQ